MENSFNNSDQDNSFIGLKSALDMKISNIDEKNDKELDNK